MLDLICPCCQGIMGRDSKTLAQGDVFRCQSCREAMYVPFPISDSHHGYVLVWPRALLNYWVEHTTVQGAGLVDIQELLARMDALP